MRILLLAVAALTQQVAQQQQVVYPPGVQQQIPVQHVVQGVQQQAAVPVQQAVPMQHAVPIQQAVPVQQQAVPVQQQAVPVQQQAVPMIQQQQQIQQPPVVQQAVPGVVHQQAVPVIQHQPPPPPPVVQQQPIVQQKYVQQQAEAAPPIAHHVVQQPAQVVGASVSHHPPPPVNPNAAAAQAYVNQQAAIQAQVQAQQAQVKAAVQQQQQQQYLNQAAKAASSSPKVVGVKPSSDYESNPPPSPQAGTSIAAQWDREMKDFMPQMILTFRLNGGESEHFHQDVTQIGTLIRGGYFESSTETSGSANSNRRHASFKILSPTGRLVHSSEKTEGLFRLVCDEVGTYTFALSSPTWAKPKFVTFVMGTGEVSALSFDDINSIEGNIKMLYRSLGEIETQNNLLWMRQRSQADQIRKTTNRTYYAFIVELICTAAAIVAQITTVKRMLSKRSLY